MESKDIIKALEYCTSLNADCRHCDKKITENCITFLMRDALGLIKNQQAEIERLTVLAELGNMRANDYRAMRDKCKTAKTEAYKEFAEKLKAKPSTDKDVNYLFELRINNLLKELTERKED